MIAVSASDEDVRTVELITIEQIVNHLPVFAEYDPERLKVVSEVVFDLYADEDGLDTLLALILENLPDRVHETAYALACDVAASDGRLGDDELRLLDEFRYAFNIERLAAAAIERAARARHITL
ncbi:tellurite resistance TerB family protein [Anianabacter salinae]|uniref:tellurite resistance TerB family protein n=1 Tax=Anianabacter salinae TaxID=2851023 RepID=UPI002B217687|nr:tellurite resistance TerB family protein [Anianabacter salinae]MBV0911008.1 tellurite resistance TerB family protein [Anianabacter salinae]